MRSLNGMTTFLLAGLSFFALLSSTAHAQLVEEERQAEYNRRNNTWPPTTFTPDTPGWRKLMSERFAQVDEMEDSGRRYEAFIQTISAALLAPNYTAHGFGLARCPDDLIEALRQGIRDGLPTASLEPRDAVIDGPLQPLFINRPDLTQRVVRELHSYVEEWAGVELTPFGAYGFRLYRNQSQLTMHVDRMQTHIISFILHIDSSDDAEPWPIFIEDFQGRTHEVILTPGDILFYESSKCFHGRPRRLNGSWYTSLFVHYYPKYGWAEQDHQLEAHYRVPPHWSASPPAEKHHTKLVMVETSMKEPECKDDWCRTVDAIKWSGPGEKGYWITPTFEKIPFNPPSRPHDEL